MTSMASTGLSRPCIQVKFWQVLVSKIRVLKLFTEPIGGAKPKFSYYSELNKLTRTAGTSICLQCPAQAFPIPAFRLVPG